MSNCVAICHPVASSDLRSLGDLSWHLHSPLPFTKETGRASVYRGAVGQEQVCFPFWNRPAGGESAQTLYPGLE